MITQAKCRSYKVDLFDGVHQPGDDYRLALYTNAATLDKNTTAYSSTGEVVGPGYTAGGQSLAGHLDGIEPRQGGQAQAQRGGAEVVAGAAGVLVHQAQALKTDQVTVRFGCAHVGAGGQIAQHQWAVSFGEHLEQREPDFNRLNACTFFHEKLSV